MNDSTNSLWVVIPVKPLAESKQRLASVYDATARIALAQALFEQTLQTVLRARGIARVLVVSRDLAVLQRTREVGAVPLMEITSGLNDALEGATHHAVANGAAALLVLPIDLPALTTADVEHMLTLGTHPPCIVLAPARRDGGTNALLLNPAGLMPFAFGERSASEHRKRAEQLGASIVVYDNENMARDLDEPEDLALLTKA